MCQPNDAAVTGTLSSERLLVFPVSMDERAIIRLAEWYESERGVDFDEAVVVVSEGGEHPSNYSVGDTYYATRQDPVTGWQWHPCVLADDDPDDDHIPDRDEREQGQWEKQNFR